MKTYKFPPPKGTDGASAYTAWLKLGNAGTEQDFLDSLKGDPGDSAYEAWLAEGNSGTRVEFLATLPGKSAYAEWLDLGNTGDEAAFIASLKGTDGDAAYDTWIGEGNSGTKQDFLDSLKGDDGESAYAAWLAEGNSGTRANFIASLKGADGDPGPQGPVGVNIDDIMKHTAILSTSYAGTGHNTAGEVTASMTQNTSNANQLWTSTGNGLTFHVTDYYSMELYGQFDKMALDTPPSVNATLKLAIMKTYGGVETILFSQLFNPDWFKGAGIGKYLRNDQATEIIEEGAYVWVKITDHITGLDPQSDYARLINADVSFHTHKVYNTALTTITPLPVNFEPSVNTIIESKLTVISRDPITFRPIIKEDYLVTWGDGGDFPCLQDCWDAIRSYDYAEGVTVIAQMMPTYTQVTDDWQSIEANNTNATIWIQGGANAGDHVWDLNGNAYGMVIQNGARINFGGIRINGDFTDNTAIQTAGYIRNRCEFGWADIWIFDANSGIRCTSDGEVNFRFGDFTANNVGMGLDCDGGRINMYDVPGAFIGGTGTELGLNQHNTFDAVAGIRCYNNGVVVYRGLIRSYRNGVNAFKGGFVDLANTNNSVDLGGCTYAYKASFGGKIHALGVLDGHGPGGTADSVGINYNTNLTTLPAIDTVIDTGWDADNNQCFGSYLWISDHVNMQQYVPQSTLSAAALGNNGDNTLTPQSTLQAGYNIPLGGPPLQTLYRWGAVGDINFDSNGNIANKFATPQNCSMVVSMSSVTTDDTPAGVASYFNVLFKVTKADGSSYTLVNLGIAVNPANTGAGFRYDATKQRLEKIDPGDVISAEVTTNSANVRFYYVNLSMNVVDNGFLTQKT